MAHPDPALPDDLTVDVSQPPLIVGDSNPNPGGTMPIHSKTWRKPILLFGTVVMALTLSAVAYHFHLKSAVDNYRAELKAKGALKEMSELRPPPVALDQDGTSLFLRAVSQIATKNAFFSNPPPAMKMVASGKAMVGSAQDQICADGFGALTNSWKELQPGNDANKEALALLTQMIERPKTDFHLPYEKGFAAPGLVTNAHLIDIKRSVQLLTGSAVIDLHEGNTSVAVQKCRAAIALTGSTEDQRLVISELLRIATAAISQTMAWEILQSGKASDSELAALQHDWEQLDFVRGYQKALAMECACSTVTLEQWRSSFAEQRQCLRYQDFVQSTGDGEEGWAWMKQAKTVGQIFLWRYWWSYTDELRELKGNEVLRQAALRVETNGAFGSALRLQETQLDSLGITQLSQEDLLFDFHSGLSQSVNSLGRCLNKAMLAEAAKRMTVAAIALKRYELAHGKYPQTLAELAPQFVKSIPLDPVDGKPLRYKLNADGTFLLYSVGENGTDDGGDSQVPKTRSTFSWQRGRDWVWPQPASQEEVLASQNKQGKKK